MKTVKHYLSITLMAVVILFALGMVVVPDNPSVAYAQSALNTDVMIMVVEVAATVTTAIGLMFLLALGVSKNKRLQAKKMAARLKREMSSYMEVGWRITN